jgi:stromal membrane-associated protein
MARSDSQPISSQTQLQPPQSTLSGVWSDLASLQGPTQTSTLPSQYLSSITSHPVPISASHPNAGGSSLGASFPTTIGPASLVPSLGVGVSQGPDALGSVTGVATQQMPPPFIVSTDPTNPFAYMATQQQAQVHAPQNSFLPTSLFGSSLPQQPSLVHQPQIPQIQQPAFSQSVTNPFFNAAAPFPGTLSPQPLTQPQAPLMSNTPSPGPFLGSPFPLPTQAPFQQQQPLFQQPTQRPFQPQPPQFGNVQAGGAAVAGSPYTSWLTQQPNTYASTHVGQGSGQWGTM